MLELEDDVALEGGSAVVSVKFIAEDQEAGLMHNVSVVLYCEEDPAGGNLFEITPDLSSGYFYDSLQSTRQPRELKFAVQQKKAETGKKYSLVTEMKFEDPAGRVVRTQDVSRLVVRASEEVYFAIGLAETVRGVAGEFYGDMVKVGRERQGDETALPGLANGEDPIQVALSKDSFDWALGLVQLGTRIYNSQKKR